MPHAVGVSLEGVTAREINISGVTVQAITQLPAPPPLWVNVPGLPRGLVGRDALVEDLVERLKGGAAAIHGLPGVGKSALAVVLAHHPQLLAQFSDGVLWGGLGRNPDVLSVLASWGEALGVDVADRVTVEQRRQAVANAIGQRRLLLVIDDAWQLEAAQGLRCGGPHCAQLLTTRDLSLARHFVARREVIKVPELAEDPAYDLLGALAPEACDADPAAARQLARAVGGLPLALELIGGFLAAPERSFFPELACEALGALTEPAERLRLACVRLGSADGRAVSLQETIALSLDGLPAATVEAFHALGAFAPKPADFDLVAATAVTAASAATLATLIARGLVEQSGPERLALHQTVADVARGGVDAASIERHRVHYLERVEGDREDWRTIEGLYGQLQWAWRQLPKTAALSATLAFVWALRLFQERRGLWADQLAWSERALALARAAGARTEVATLLNNLGKVYSDLGEPARALEYYEQALPLSRQVGDKAGEATTLNNIGAVHSDLGENTRALEYYEQALPLHRQVGDQAGEAATLNNIGLVYSDLGENTRALGYYEQALPLRRQVGDKAGEATTLTNIGKVYSDLGEKTRALEYYEQALPLFRQVGDKAGEAATLTNIGKVYSDLGEKTRALEYFEQALPLFRQVGDKAGEAATLNNIGKVYSDLGEKTRALEYFVQALPLFRQVGDRRGESVTRFNLAFVHEALGDLVKAEAELREVVTLDEALGHPDLELDRATLLRIQQLRKATLPTDPL